MTTIINLYSGKPFQHELVILPNEVGLIYKDPTSGFQIQKMMMTTLKHVFGKIGLAFCFAFFALSLCKTAFAQSWNYAAIDVPQSAIGIQRNPDQIAIGDLAYHATFCGAQESYYCFKGRGIEFAIPKDLNSLDTIHYWHFNGKGYKATPAREALMIIGQPLYVFYIDTTNQTPGLRFIFSKERGLVAIKELNEKNNLVFLLQRRCGFAAPASCGLDFNQTQQ